MDEVTLVIFPIELILCIALNVFFICKWHKSWITKKTLERDTFIKWRGTNKAHVWWKVWSIILCTDIVPILVVSLYFKDAVSVGFVGIITLLAYLLGGPTIYAIVILIIQSKHN